MVNSKKSRKSEDVESKTVKRKGKSEIGSKSTIPLAGGEKSAAVPSSYHLLTTPFFFIEGKGVKEKGESNHGCSGTCSN